MRIVLVLVALAFMRCMEMDWDRTATEDAFSSYDYRSKKVLKLEEESAKTLRNALPAGGGGSSTILILAAGPVFFRDDRGRVAISDVRRNYEEDRELDVNVDPASDVELDTLFDQDLP